MNRVSEHSIKAIELLQAEIESLGFTPVIQFELEGTYRPYAKLEKLDFGALNTQLQKNNIQGIVKPEYWQYQWEYASQMKGQTPMKSAQDLHWVIENFPNLLKDYGAKQVYIKPVCWGKNTENRPLDDKDFEEIDSSKTVHVPNSIQINISATDESGTNAIAYNGLGERLQQQLLHSSYECSLLYSPEEEAFQRLSLKQDYKLHDELSSPSNLSGGHQGSVALYKELGKHNQILGAYNNETKTYGWQALSRVEHRLGASSQLYNPYLNCAFALLNLFEALVEPTKKTVIPNFNAQIMPKSLKESYELFKQSNWFEEQLNRLNNASKEASLGSALKTEILKIYTP